MPRSPFPASVLAALGLSVALLAGCAAGEPASIDPQGVDGLEIPTTSPDPADFVATIDNPWLPLAPGTEWVYATDAGASITVTVLDVSRRIAGVETTAVATDVVRRGSATTSTYWYAQDRDGNVWSFGAETTDDPDGDWAAGVAGARAGLVMPARPRIGDGFRQHDVPGREWPRSSVLDTDASASVPYADSGLEDLLEIRVRAGSEGTDESTRYYGRGIGLVLVESEQDDLGDAELVSLTRP